MTREEAIERLKTMRWEHATNPCPDRTAFDMAISALSEQESLKERMEKLYLVESLKEDFENLTKENERLRNALSENKGDLISRQAIEEINSEIPKIHELFDIAYEYNKEDSTRTELSQKCTTYLLDIWQTLGAIVDNYPSAENKREWIPTSERLPEIGQCVLCSLGEFSDHQIVLAQYSSAKWWDYVEAWQPLPEPYKAEKRGEI